MEFLDPELAGMLVTYGPILAMVVIFYFMIYRPQKDEQRKRADMLHKLHKGNKVMTIGGLYGEVVDIKDGVVDLKIADKVVIKVNKVAINKNISQGISMVKDDEDITEEEKKDNTEE